jgi:hypothetical protein
MVKNPLYVCSVCGQDFTRRYNANRHNQNIHSDKADIVRFLEYLIGRICAKYLPGDPLSYRLKNGKNNNKTTFVHESADNNNLLHEKSNPPTKTVSYEANPREGGMDGFNSVAGANTRTNPTLDYLLRLKTIIQLQERKHQEFLKQKIQDKLKDIELMLHDFNDPDTVRTLITELTKKYYATTDYVGFNRELESYRDSLVDRYLHWR